MRAVLRFPVVLDDQPHEVPDGKIVLFGRGNLNRSAGGAEMDVWVECEVTDDWETGGRILTPPSMVRIFGTGQPVPEGWLHCDTVIDGAFVWHLYQWGPPR